MGEKWKNSHFVLEIAGIQSPKIDEVQNLSFGEAGTIETVDAGTNTPEKMSTGIVKFEPLTLVKNADGTQSDTDWLDWWKTTFNMTDRAESQGSQERRNGAIIKLEYGVEVARFAFVGAWIKSFKLSDLDSTGEDPAQWTIVLEHDGMYPELL